MRGNSTVQKEKMGEGLLWVYEEEYLINRAK